MSSESILRADGGRWVRRRGSIVLLPADGANRSGEMEFETGPIPATQQGVIHPAIDVHAQHALMRMSRGDPAAQADAWGMLGAVRGGRLGIYKADQQKPALRAKKLGGSWWTVIPAGEDAAVLRDPSVPEPPFIVFRDAVKNLPARLDPALRKAWRTARMLHRCEVAGTGGAEDVLPGSLTPANLFPRHACVAGRAPGPNTPPAKMPVLTHYHRRSRVSPPGFPCDPGPLTVMQPAAMNPGFIDPATGKAHKGEGRGSLQQKLESALARRFPLERQQVSAAVVDLTGDRLCMPMFAGWQETVNFDAGSLAKICALYAAFQLRFDLRSMARRMNITHPDMLEDAARAIWADEGLPKKEQPEIRYLFDLASPGGGQVTVAPSRRLLSLLDCTFVKNCNWTASILINRIGLPFISSALWSAGLLDTRTRGGLWLQSGFCSDPGEGCDTTTRHCPRNADADLNCRRVEQLRRTRAYGGELGLAQHNATALSVAAFYTLLAQDRLPDASGTQGMSPFLSDACANFKAMGQLRCVFRRLGKCGFTAGSRVGTGELHHDGRLVERWTSEACGTTPVRYVIVLLTNGVSGVQARFDALLKDVDRMILENNGIPVTPSTSAEPGRPAARLRLPGGGQPLSSKAR